MNDAVACTVSTRPHDALFKSAFGASPDATGLFQHVLPPAVVAAVQWSTLVREPGSFVDPNLTDRHSDLLFSAQLAPPSGGERALLYVLVEHQSYVDEDMPLRVLGYQLRIWEQHAARPRPLILPVVLAHAIGGWSAPTCFEAQFAPHPDELGIADLVPRFTVTVLDLSRRTDEEIMAWSIGAFQKLALWLLRDTRVPGRFEAALPRWRSLLAEAHDAALRAEHGMAAFARLLQYVWHVAGDVRFTTFRAKLLEHLPQAQDTVMTIAEELIATGREQGRARVAAILHRMLVIKFGPAAAATEARVAAATFEELERYLERVIAASSLGDVFGD